MLIFFLIWFASIFLAAWVGSQRNCAGAGLLLGIFLGPIGAIAAFALVDNRKKCPYCKEQIDKDAIKCPRCQSDLATVAVPALKPRDWSSG